MKMVRKLSFWIFVTVLLTIESNGFTLSNFRSSLEIEDIDLDIDLDDDSSMIDESDYWDLLSQLSGAFDEDDLHAKEVDEKWDRIDNLVLTDDADDNEFVQMEQHSEVQGAINYSLGQRRKGDRIVAVSAKNQTWPRIQNVWVNMTYPARGYLGRKLTYILVQVNQTTNLGQAKVVNGGIGQRFINLTVEAYYTSFFNYRTTFYGL